MDEKASVVSCDCSTVATRCGGVGLMLDNLGTARLSLVQQLRVYKRYQITVVFTLESDTSPGILAEKLDMLCMLLGHTLIM